MSENEATKERESTTKIVLYHGTTDEYLRGCTPGEQMPETIRRTPLENEGEYHEWRSTNVWLTNDPTYARIFGGKVACVLVDPKHLERRGSPGDPKVGACCLGAIPPPD